MNKKNKEQNYYYNQNEFYKNMYNRGRTYNSTNYSRNYQDYTYYSNQNYNDRFYYEKGEDKNNYKKRGSQSDFYNKNEREEFEYVDRFYLYRDPYTGKFYRVRQRDVNNFSSRRSGKSSGPYSVYDEVYNNKFEDEREDYEGELTVGVRHFIAILLVGLSIIFYVIITKTRREAWQQNAVIYKNTIYYPKNKDPIIEELVKKRGYVFPKEIFHYNNNYK